MAELLRRLDHAWRVFGTGLSFVAFGLGGLLLGVLVMPVLLLMRDPVVRRRRARRVVQAAFASHLRLMRGLGVMTYEIEGGERLQRDGLLVLANHPTLIDVVCLISLLPNADCVVKRAVACNPFMRGPVRAAGYISNDDGAGLVDDCVAAVHAGGTLVIFPEMMRAGWFAPTLNLAEVDPRCGQLDFITGQGRELQAEYVMSNNFAFGGINTSLVFRRWSE